MSARMEKVREALMRPAVDRADYERLAAALAEVEETEARLAATKDDLRVTEGLATDERERRIAAEAEADRLKAALTEYNLRRVFWKHTVDADLNTDEGCTQAAQAVVAYIAALAPADRNTT